MKTYRRLRRLFQAAALSTAAASSSVSSQGRVAPPTDRPAATVDGPVDRTEFVLNVCPPGVSGETVEDLHPTSPVDFVAFRSASTRGARPSWITRAYAGTPCDTATRADICLGQIDKRWPYGWGGESYASRARSGIDQFVYSRGDEVRRITTHAELLAFLGDIDTALEAMWVARTESDTVRYRVDCHDFNARPIAEGFEVILSDGGSCGESIWESRVRVSTAGVVTVLERRLASVSTGSCIIVGRLTAGTRIQRRDTKDGIGARLAEMAMLEAAAVHAFDRLERELRWFDAPDDLVARARRSACDEARHAKSVGALAERRGGIVDPVAAPGAQVRDLFEIAVENTVEGTVRETFGAALATLQAKTATDPEIARLFRTIAVDETHHAALSLDVARWLESRLDAVQKARLHEERAAATRALLVQQIESADRDATRAEGRALGLPNADAVRSLFAATFPKVWS